MQGILVAGRGGSINDKKGLTYSSLNNHLQVDTLKKNPKLFDVVTVDAGNALVVSDGFTQEEDVFSVTHGLGYKPTVWVFFFIYAKGSNTDSGQYSTGTYIFAGSTVNDLLRFEVNETALRIIHKVENISYGGAYTSIAANYKLRLKYYIFNNRASNTFVNISNSGLLAIN